MSVREIGEYERKIMKKFESGTNVIAHGDGDGTIAAAVARRAGVDGRLTVTQPFLLAKLPDLAGPTVVVDLAVDNKNPVATLDWARRNAGHIVAWVDHHAGGEGLADVLGEKFIYDPTAPSCPQVMFDRGFDVPADWLAAANACDAPTKFAPTPLAERYNAAFKVALVALQNGDRKAVEAVQAAFVAELVSGNPSELVTANASRYPALNAATETAVAGLAEFYANGVGHVDLPGGQASVDVTQVMVRGYKKFAIIVITTTSAEDGQPITLVGTNRKPDELNLVAAFGLDSGNPSRIVLTGEAGRVENVRDILVAHLGHVNCPYCNGAVVNGACVACGKKYELAD
jgi:hypothetical protein